jgi:hypothetical protein
MFCPARLFRAADTTGLSNCHTSRHSREPPAYQPIELPRYKAASLQGSTAIPYAGPKPLFEHEYEDDNRRRQRLRAPIDSFDSHRIFFN